MTDAVQPPRMTAKAALARYRLDHCGCCGGRGTARAGHAQGLDVLRCRRCGTLRFEAIADPAEIYGDSYHTAEGDFGFDYDANTRGYDDAQAADRLAVIGRHVRPGTLLDVGGGLGGFSEAARRRGWDAELLEPVEAACERARSVGVPAYVGGAEALPSLGKQWDVLTFLHSIEHVPEACATLASARGAVADGGVLFVEVPNHASMSRYLQGDGWLGWQAGEHVYLFTEDTIVGLVERAGYEVVEVRSYVPGWHGMLSEGYAHMLGVQVAMSKAVAALKKVKRAVKGSGEGIDFDPNAPSVDGLPPGRVPISQEGAPVRWVFTYGFDALTRVEEAFGWGTNLQVVARPR